MPYTVIDPSLAEPAPLLTLGTPLTSVGETLESMRAELFLMLGGRTDVDDPRLDKWINFSYIDVWTSLKLEEAEVSFSFDTVSGQPFYELPGIVRSTKGAALVDNLNIYGGLSMEKIDLASYRRLMVAEGTPTSYFRSGRVMVLYPTPSSIYTIAVDFRMIPARLVNDTDSPILGEEWHESILLGARKKAFSALMEFDKAMPAENDYVNSVRRRTDTAAAEDEGRIVGSSVPRNGRMLRRRDGLGEDY